MDNIQKVCNFLSWCLGRSLKVYMNKYCGDGNLNFNLQPTTLFNIFTVFAICLYQSYMSK
jgi:hypothetical protein